MDDLVAARDGRGVGCVDVVDLDRHVRRHRRAGVVAHHAELHAVVLRRRERQDPAEVHDDLQPDDVLVEPAARGRVGGVQVGDDALDGH
jgi:hypothetical protein